MPFPYVVSGGDCHTWRIHALSVLRIRVRYHEKISVSSAYFELLCSAQERKINDIIPCESHTRSIDIGFYMLYYDYCPSDAGVLVVFPAFQSQEGSDPVLPFGRLCVSPFLGHGFRTVCESHRHRRVK